MNSLIEIFAMAPGGGQGGQPQSFLTFLPLIAIFVVMYFLIIMPQSKQRKQLQKMIAELEKGDKVMTTGGIIGTIGGIKEAENTVYLKVTDTVKIEVAKSAIGKVLKKRGT